MHPLLIIDHDGNVDDIIAVALQLMHAPERIACITISPADCYALPTVWYTQALQELLLNHTRIPVGIGVDEGVNKFPELWRNYSWNLAQLPLWHSVDNTLERFSLEHIPPAEQLLTQALINAQEPITILETGPCSNIVSVLTKYPHLKDKITRIFIMGGAINSKGNVEEPKHDGSAEWNIYNHPQAFLSLLQQNIPITLVPLEATNNASIRPEFIKELGNLKQYTACQLVYNALMTVKTVIDTGEYMLWDALTSAAIIDPKIITTETMQINVELTGRSMGRTYQDPHGFTVEVAISASQNLFEETMLTTFTKNSSME